MENKNVKRKKKNNKKSNKGKVLEISLGKIFVRAIILLIIALGFIWLYNNKFKKSDNKVQMNETFEYSNSNEFNDLDIKNQDSVFSLYAKDYVGVWQKYYINQEDPDYELNIISIEDKIVRFNFSVNRVAQFKNQTAQLDGNKAEFTTEINNESSDWTIKGIITFENNVVKLKIKESQYEDLIPKIEIKFENKSKESKITWFLGKNVILC